ncbi:MAG: glycosyltransferase family 4 protein [Anaerolineae bacterium]|nr:glycosyltransferase family 4 protein [Anaerolineae bacterium]
MRVIYDISPVGSRPETRTGLARVAWSTALALHQQLGSNLRLSACGSIWAALETESLLQDWPDLPSALYPIDSFTKTLQQIQENLNKYTNSSASPLKSISHYASNLFLTLSRLRNVTRLPLDPQSLANADIFHSSYARIPRQVRRSLKRRHILTVHDLTPLILNGRYFSPGQIEITNRIISSIHPGDWVIAVSHSTKNDLCNRRSLSPERVCVIPNAASKEYFYPIDDPEVIQTVRRRYNLPEGPYLLTLHSLAAHKNLGHLIDCFKRTVTQQAFHDLTLVIAGGNKQAVQNTRGQFGLNDKSSRPIHFTGYIDDNDLAALYSGAMAFVFPSLYEGFGLPVLEAMQCGCPVITSNVSALPEVVENAGILVNPSRKDELCQALTNIYHDRNLRENLSLLSKQRASIFSWDTTIQKTVELYSKIGDG